MAACRDRAGGHEAFTRVMTFARCRITLSLTFNADNRLVGLFFSQPEAIDDNPPLPHEREFTLQTDGFDLPARLTLPGGEKGRKYPCVVLVHGSGPSDMNESVGANKPFRDLAEGLSRRGIAVIRYEKRTHVYDVARHGLPKGRQLDYDTETVDDVLTAIDSARVFPEVCRDSIYVVGHSLGAMLAPRIAERSGHLAGIVMLAGTPRKLMDVLRDQNIAALKTSDAAVVDSVMAVARRQLPESYIAFDSLYSAGATAARLRLPMLLLQGERDVQVTVADYRAWDKWLKKNRGVVRRTYPLLNHLFVEDTGKPVAEEYNTPSHIPGYVMDDIAQFVRTGKIAEQ
ncbi:alpha/beta hydrolase family protein [Prevotella dentasini]|uniref:alpha/beta hydrolase family protein n=1 Tax=Prevotella dentasini TaxID=589537 RepID=UPI0011DCCBF5|nr:alpha/beta fold hydrolase [Prevotella dentasini]